MNVDEALGVMNEWHKDGDFSCCRDSVTCTLALAVEHLRQVLIDQGVCVHWTGEVDARVRVPDPSCPYCSLDGTP